MAEESVDIHSEILGIIGIESNKLDRSSYRLQNGNVIMIKYSKLHDSNNLLQYWFGLTKKKFGSHPVEKFFILLVCGSIDQVLVIPATYLSELLRDVSTAKDGDWKFHIYKRPNIFEISAKGKPNEDVSKYLNTFQSVSELESA